MAKKNIKFMCTAFRDGFQSVIGARVLSKDFLPAVEAAYDAGIRWFEAGGGARFQSCYFYCQEDAFDVMDKFRKAAPEADLQTLSRGVNVVGLESQPSDMIKLHAQMFKKHGMTSIRNFDALNDVNNLKWSGQCIHDAGLKHEVVVTMMGLPPGIDNQGTHTPEFYAGRLRLIKEAGIPFDRVCFKDASGTSTQATVYKTMKLAREVLGPKVHIQFHSHETAGNGIACYLAAIRGGADGLDLSMAPMSGGTCQPDIITMWHALDGDPDFALDVDIEKIRKAEAVFKDCMKDYFLPPEAMNVSPAIIWSPMPGGALTANTQMLRDNNMMDKYDDMIAEMYDCVRLGGFGTSVTPVSQFYAQQAIQNVMFGKFKKFAPGYAKMVLGYFGKTPVSPDPEIVKLASEALKLEPTTKTVLELNDADTTKGRAAAEKALKEAGLPVTDENVFIAAACREKGILFLKDPSKAPMGCRFNKDVAPKAAATGPCTVTVNGKAYGIELKGDKAIVNGREIAFKVEDGLKGPAASGGAQNAGGAGTEVKANVPGSVLRVNVKPGDSVAKGDELLVMDVMKMEQPVVSPVDGAVQSVLVAQTDKVNTGDVLVVIG
ncbi:MAG: biotin attachment protein [Kiritimatiellae bacterium]|nr:biotin attachment protein [Kiritimatiellia bacterium]